jgi:predicted DNA-binding antitoxin AbrB/MazE fold protein
VFIEIYESDWREDMPRTVKAVFHKGAFVPRESCDIPDGAEVELIIQSPFFLSPEIEGAEEKVRILKIVVDRMQQNPIPTEAPRLTREALHERR